MLLDLADRIDQCAREMAADKAAKARLAPQTDPAEFSRGELLAIECLRGAGKPFAAAAAIVLARRGVPKCDPLRR